MPLDPTGEPRIVIVTGPSGSGKTTTCRALVDAARRRGWRVAGILCPALLQDGEKMGIIATDLASGQTRALAIRRPPAETGELGYRFDPEVLAWADLRLAASLPCDLLVVDELGPLELDRGAGLLSAFDLLNRGAYRLALVVVRPRLVRQVRRRLRWTCRVLNVAAVRRAGRIAPERASAPALEDLLGPR